MKKHEIENWALEIIQRAESKQPIEDSLVELKSYWLEPEKAARRIAAHANAARGERILWLIGVDEKQGVIIGASQEEFANWIAGIRAEFDGLAPSVIDVNVPYKNKTVVALLFETDRAPFVVKNPVFGQQGAGSVSLEVPWREATAIRSATRSDLIKLLTPIQKKPTFDTLSSRLDILKAKDDMYEGHSGGIRLSIVFYIVHRSERSTVIPFHKCGVSFEVMDSTYKWHFENISFEHFISLFFGRSEPPSPNIAMSNTELIISGPGMVQLQARSSSVPSEKIPDGKARVFVRMEPIDSETPLSIEIIMPRLKAIGDEYLASWSYRESIRI